MTKVTLAVLDTKLDALNSKIDGYIDKHNEEHREVKEEVKQNTAFRNRFAGMATMIGGIIALLTTVVWKVVDKVWK